MLNARFELNSWSAATVELIVIAFPTVPSVSVWPPAPPEPMV